MNYQDTGNKIPVPVQELTAYVQKKLAEYDQLNLLQISPHGSIDSLLNDKPNPYNDTIIYMTKDGRLIKVPKDIQNIAIDLWNSNKNVQDVNKYYSTSEGDQLPNNMTQNISEVNPGSSTTNNGFNWLYLLIILLVLLFIGYIIYSYTLPSVVITNPTNQRYFLTNE